jgi:ankyrin repeat protein
MVIVHHHHINSGNCDVIQCLLNFGADINLRDDDKQSPLLIASRYGFCDVVRCLLSYHPDINLCNDDEQSPLFIASRYGRCDVSSLSDSSRTAPCAMSNLAIWLYS